MKSKSNLFVCSTQYAILNAINLISNDPEKKYSNSDIVIFHQTDGIKELSEMIKKNKVFHDVYDFPFINNKNLIYLIGIILFPKFFLERVCLSGSNFSPKGNFYNKIFSQNQLYASLFSRFNKDADVYLIEDGLSSYTGRTLEVARRSFLFRLINKTFLRRYFFADIKGQALYRPEMLCGPSRAIIKLPEHKITNNCIYNSIFKYKKTDVYDVHKFVYLGVPYYGLRDLMIKPESVSFDFEKSCKIIVDTAMNSLSKKDFIYRTHPIEKIEISHYKNLCKVDECENMWELECQNKISDDHILMSFFSTAAFTPKMLYGKQPYVIFLYKILGLEMLNADKLVFGLRAMYSAPKKIIVPETICELVEVISGLELLRNSKNTRESVMSNYGTSHKRLA
jgi:hypothetical protein